MIYHVSGMAVQTEQRDIVMLVIAILYGTFNSKRILTIIAIAIWMLLLIALRSSLKAL